MTRRRSWRDDDVRRTRRTVAVASRDTVPTVVGLSLEGDGER